MTRCQLEASASMFFFPVPVATFSCWSAFFIDACCLYVVHDRPPLFFCWARMARWFAFGGLCGCTSVNSHGMRFLLTVTSAFLTHPTCYSLCSCVLFLHCSWLIRKCQHLAKSRISRIQAIESRLLIKYLIHMHAILEILDSGASGGPVNEARNGGDC
jgi:hypothetical protein